MSMVHSRSTGLTIDMFKHVSVCRRACWAGLGHPTENNIADEVLQIFQSTSPYRPTS